MLAARSAIFGGILFPEAMSLKNTLKLLRDAIADDRMALTVQGVHAVRNRDHLLYSECLASIREFDGTLHRAPDFIPELEAMGALTVLDRHMLQKVLDVLDGDRFAVLGCNLSVGNLRNAASWAKIIETIADRPHLASRLVLEITESLEFANISAARNMLAEAKALGCRIAIDDFGVGHASPARLFALDVDIVKIDALFVRDRRASTTNGWSSLHHMVGLAACFAPAIVVEGVETAEHFKVAAAAGATHVQGYLLSRPVQLGTWLDGNTSYLRHDDQTAA